MGTEEAANTGHLLGYGDRVRLTGPKGKMHTLTLVPGGEFHTHKGFVRHDDIVGGPEASLALSSASEQYLVERPLLSDYVMSMPRGAAIVYPKDAAQILVFGDVFPGAVVLEAGVGSGALSLWLLRAIGPEGKLISIERREEFAEIARANVHGFHGQKPDQWRLELGDFQDVAPRHCESGEADRVILDMLAPWECVESSAELLKPGGVLVAYVATVTQLSRMAEAIRESGAFTHPSSHETLVRSWHVEGLAVRPDHRMVAHTGFLIIARRLAPGTTLPALKRRPSKSEFTDEDVEIWTPEALGLLEKSSKTLRKNARRANRHSDDKADTSGQSGNTAPAS